jgi:hypothetical protein
LLPSWGRIVLFVKENFSANIAVKFVEHVLNMLNRLAEGKLARGVWMQDRQIELDFRGLDPMLCGAFRHDALPLARQTRQGTQNTERVSIATS